MKPNRRWLILGSLLVATLVAAYLVEDQPASEKGKRKGSIVTKSLASLSLLADSRRTAAKETRPELATAPLNFPEPAPLEELSNGKKIIDPFRNKSWYVAPPPPKLAKPTAPPLPFQYLGKLIEEGESRVFLNYQGKYLITKVGDVINGTYSVEEIAGGRMTFLYQPLKEIQVLAIGAEK